MKASRALNDPVKATRIKAAKAKPSVAKHSSLFLFQIDNKPNNIEKIEAKLNM